MSASTPRSEGFTLIEVMIAATILLVGILGTFSMVDQAQQTTQGNAARSNVLNLSREILEQARSLDYEHLAPATMVPALRTRPGLAEYSTTDAAGRWVITRRGVPLTITATVCTFDDPMDGLAAVPPADACPGAAAVSGAPVETNPDDFRRVMLVFEWTAEARTQTTRQATLIANPTGGRGPRIVSFPDPFALQITASGTVSVPFVATTTFAAAVRWSMDDGVQMGDATGGPTLWGFNWDIGTVGLGSWTVDGTYTASAQPFDSRGVPGEMRVASVLLNRRVPLAPAGVKGGRSAAGGGVIELEWNRNSERDILGYRVYRVGLTSKTRICPPASTAGDGVITTTACTDTAPNTLGHYKLAAVDRPTLGDPASGTREGDVVDFVADPLGLRPDPPTALTGIVENGRVKLTWTPPLGLDILFYRIYRDGIRIDRTVSSTPEYVDRDPVDGQPHTYVVTAVGLTFNESLKSNEVVVTG